MHVRKNIFLSVLIIMNFSIGFSQKNDVSEMNPDYYYLCINKIGKTNTDWCKYFAKLWQSPTNDKVISEESISKIVALSSEFKDYYTQSILYSPIAHKNESLAKRLIDSGVNPDHSNKDHIILATIKGYSKVLKAMLDSGVQFNDFESNGGRQLLYYALQSKSLDTIQLVFENNGGDINHKNIRLEIKDLFSDEIKYKYETPIQTYQREASFSLSNPIFRYLINNGANLAILDENKNTFIQQRCLYAGNYFPVDNDSMELFLSRGVNINNKNLAGETILTCLAKRFSTGAIKEVYASIILALDYGADPTILDNSGNNFYDYIFATRYPKYTNVQNYFDSVITLLFSNALLDENMVTTNKNNLLCLLASTNSNLKLLDTLYLDPRLNELKNNQNFIIEKCILGGFLYLPFGAKQADVEFAVDFFIKNNLDLNAKFETSILDLTVFSSIDIEKISTLVELGAIPSEDLISSIKNYMKNSYNEPLILTRYKNILDIFSKI